jgi:hypothetical protein
MGILPMFFPPLFALVFSPPRSHYDSQENMKLLCPLIFGFVTISCLRASDIHAIPPAFQRILSLPQSTWTPSSEQLKSALTATHTFLKDPTGASDRDKQEIQKILQNTKGYRVQAWGVVQDGKRCIHLNFFPAPPASGEDHYSYWTKRQVMVCDGGFDYWEAEIDLATWKVVAFRSNGYA